MKALKLLLACAALIAAAPVIAAARVDAALAPQIAQSPLSPTSVVITYESAPGAAQLDALRLLGIQGGVVLQELPMVLTAVNQAQFNGLLSQPGIRSIWGNRLYRPMTNASRTFIGLDAASRDGELRAKNAGLPYTGRGVGVAYVDTGIDATHPDLQPGQNVVQNVFFPLGEVQTGAIEGEIAALTGISIGVPELPRDFVPPIYVEDAPISEIESGHGTFGAAITAGLGTWSAGFYGGVAQGAKLIGLDAGNDLGLTNFSILQAYDYALVNQIRYNIRVVNNSFGSTLAGSPYDPNDPIQVGTRKLHDRYMAVVFAAGNGIDGDGDVPGAINPLSVAPWVISVAAGEKQGLGAPARFSSRGENDGPYPDFAGQPADPLAPPNLRPDLIAPGVDIKSARSKAPGISSLAGTLPIFVGSNDLMTIAPAHLPFYTTGAGTSFAAPHVSGVIAMMIEANPLLTPDHIVTILRNSTTPMPYPERVVGAGYLDAHNAVRAAADLAPVDHPFNLFPDPSQPQIRDPQGDQLGTSAQDIVWGRFEYDAVARQLVYTLKLFDLETATTNHKWIMQSKFGPTTTIFVAAEITETGLHDFEYGRITINPNTGVTTQATIGPADGGAIDLAGDTVTVRLSIDKINAAVTDVADVVGTTSTATAARGQIVIGSPTVQPLLFLNSDAASGGDYEVRDRREEEEDPDPPAPCTGPLKEQMPGQLAAGGPGQVDLPLTMRCGSLDAKLTYHPGNVDVLFELFDGKGTRVATATESSGKRLRLELAPGAYRFRVSGSPGSKAVDFVVRATQE